MAKRRPKSRTNGEGSIFRLGDGRWKASLTIGFVDGRQIRKTRTRSTQADARAALDDLRAEYSTGSLAADRTLPDFLREWLKDEASKLRSNTQDLYRRTIENHISPYFLRKPLRSLRPLAFRAWLKLLADRGVGSRTQQVAYNTLKTAMDYAVAMEYIDSNPLETQRRPAHQAEEIDPFEGPEIAKILKATRGTDMHVACVLSLVLGLREAEVFGLRMIDVDMINSTLTVTHQATDRGKERFAKLKTKASRRTIVMPPIVVDAIRDQQRIKLASGLAGSDLVFPAPKGEPWRRSNFIRRRWIPLLQRLSIRHRGFHHCRHSAATQMLAAKPPIPAVTVAHILGHANASITLRIYAHYLPAHGADAVGALQQLYG